MYSKTTYFCLLIFDKSFHPAIDTIMITIKIVTEVTREQGIFY